MFLALQYQSPLRSPPIFHPGDRTDLLCAIKREQILTEPERRRVSTHCNFSDAAQVTPEFSHHILN